MKLLRYCDMFDRGLQMGVTLSRLASVQRNLGKLDESIASLEKAEKMFGHNDIYRAVIISKLGVTYRYKENPEKSLHYAKEAETIINKHGNKDHPGKCSPILSVIINLRFKRVTSEAKDC